MGWRKFLFAVACIGIITLSVAIICAAWAEVVTGEPIYSMIMKLFAMTVAILGLTVGMLRIPKDNIL